MSEYICESNMNPHYDRNGNKLVEIVRCRDCKHYNSYQDLCERLKPGMVVIGDGYCAWGERKSV